MNTRQKLAPAGRSGFALIAVLWMVSALAILASGLIHAVRSEISGVQHLLESERASAAADAAILLFARDMLERQNQGEVRFERRTLVFEGTPVEIMMVPAIGLIDINQADVLLLRDLFQIAGGVSQALAEQLAEGIVTRRTADPLATGAETAPVDHAEQRRRRMQRFDVIEDLMQIDGMDFELFARIRDLVTLASGQTRVYPPAAPFDVLAVLAGGDVEASARFALQREAGDPATDASSLSHRLDSSPGGSVYRVDAIVSLPSGSRYSRRIWVDFSADGSGHPFRVLDLQGLRSVGREA